MKDGGPNFWIETNLQNVSIIWSPLLYFNLKSSMDPNTSSFIRFRSTFLRVLKFLEIIKRDPNFWGEPILQNVWIILSPYFCISIINVIWTQIFVVHLISVISAWIRSTFVWVLKFRQIKAGGIKFLGETKFAECQNYLVLPSVFQS